MKKDNMAELRKIKEEIALLEFRKKELEKNIREASEAGVKIITRETYNFTIELLEKAKKRLEKEILYVL
jgi:flagellar biosynthesis chaperone FliJ